jgi:hypothetical protein
MIDEIKFDEIMRFCPSNRLVFDELQESINNKNVMPFVGAGISAFAYKTWRNILLELSENLSSKEKNIAVKQIANNNYLDAAQTICDSLGKTIFFTTLRRLYSEDKIDDNVLKENAAYYIPRICEGNCITTNYDRVIEHSCMLNSIVFDTAGINETLKLATYYRAQNRKGLVFKIHGDILSNTEDILLSRYSYEKHYAKGGELRRQLEKWISGRTFLFVGASLFNDEPIQILTDIIEEGMTNYAIYSCSQNELNYLRDQFDKLKILPILYDKKDHSSLTLLLKKLLIV